MVARLANFQEKNNEQAMVSKYYDSRLCSMGNPVVDCHGILIISMIALIEKS